MGWGSEMINVLKPLAREPPYATGAALKETKRPKKKKIILFELKSALTSHLRNRPPTPPITLWK